MQLQQGYILMKLLIYHQNAPCWDWIHSYDWYSSPILHFVSVGFAGRKNIIHCRGSFSGRILLCLACRPVNVSNCAFLFVTRVVKKMCMFLCKLSCSATLQWSWHIALLWFEISGLFSSATSLTKKMTAAALYSCIFELFIFFWLSLFTFRVLPIPFF